MKGWLTVDIGGTKLAAAAYDGQRLTALSQIPTFAQDGAERVIDRLIHLLSETAERSGLQHIQGVGIACPGPLSAKRGVVIRAPLLGWENVPLTDILSQRFGCPVVLENDANAAALGEFLFGSGQGATSLAYITVSTGVGCGVVLDGSIWEGAHEAAGELGHVVIRRQGRKCACGRRGCLERYASGTAVGEQATTLYRRLVPDHPPISAKEAADLARAGNSDMRRLFAQAGEALGQGIAILLQLIDVERIVLGGSMTLSLDLMLDSLTRTVQRESYWGDHSSQWLRRAALGGNSGLYGAAALISNHYVKGDGKK